MASLPFRKNGSGLKKYENPGSFHETTLQMGIKAVRIIRSLYYGRVSYEKCRLAGLVILGQLMVSLVFPGFFVFAENPAQETSTKETIRFELEEIVVTATGIDEPIRDIPRNVTVITSEDIEQAPSNNVTDLIARESGITLRSFFGNDKQTVVDVRGMGATAVSNVIVMVDGFKLNSPDLTGADLSSVPLDQIERIEIVRGAGSVLYGDGAVGGVINIITKKGQKAPETRLYALGGSYETFDGRLSHRGQIDTFSYSLNADYYNSDGYRDNGFLRKKDTGMDLGYRMLDSVTFSLSGSYHEDGYGLPGPVSKADIDSKDKRILTDRPNDSGETTDKRVIGGIEIDLGDTWGIVKAKRGYRYRDNDYILGYTPLLSLANQTKRIDEDTKTLDVSLIKTYELRGYKHLLRCGLDHFDTLYISTKDDRKNSEVEDFGFFLMNEWVLGENLTFHLGYRHNDFQGTFRTDQRKKFGNVKRWINGTPFDRNWKNDAYETGIVCAFNPETSFFAGYATSFRTPNVDELAEADDDLHPQEGDHIELGARHQIPGIIELSTTLFRTTITDEIYYGEVPGTGNPLNRNFDEKTIRQGIETDVKAYPTDSLYLWGNFTFMTAKFDSRETTVPLVPEYKSTIGFEWHIVDPLVLAITGTFVGPRYDGLDETNDRFEKLGAYEVFDGKLTYTYNGLSIFAGINNLFDEIYSSVAFGETYYPMPERNIYAGAKWVF